MKILCFLLFAAVLPMVGHYQETTVISHAQVMFHQAVYAQNLAAAAMITVATALLGAAWFERRSLLGLGGAPRFLHFSPAWFALPAIWQERRISSFGGPDGYTEIIWGRGGPMTWLLLLAAAALLIATDAYWRQREAAGHKVRLIARNCPA